MLNAVSATWAILRRPILVAFYDTHGDTEDTFSTETPGSGQSKTNKHSESIAKAIQVPYRPKQILAKGNNSCKSKLSVTKLKLDLYYVMTNLYTKFQVNISKDSREKSGKPKCDGRTD